MLAERKVGHMDEPVYETLNELAEISAAALRVMVLENKDSGIDTLKPFVRFRIEEAAKTLDECAERLAALEKYVELIQAADREAFSELCESVRSRE
jgi:hypothetical protein